MSTTTMVGTMAHSPAVKGSATSSKFYSIWWSNRDGRPQAMIGIHGDSEIDALRNYAAVNNLYDYGWMIEATVGDNVCLRRYSDDGNCTGEIFAEVSPVNQFRN
jgi:hypothetical protein